MENIILIVSIANMLLVATLVILVPKKSFGKGGRGSGRSMILDSCALIDGRIIDIVQAGFTPEKLIIPAFIIRELQQLADGSDSQKRERSRYGLDIANQLKELAGVDVSIDQRDFADVTLIDDKLVLMAKQISAQLYTLDFNLSKVAEVEGVKVLNVNELAQRLKPNMLPGETISVKLIQKGSNRGQGVGYADDGTMIVVEQGDRYVGKTVEVEVDRMHNTFAGKMIFAKLHKPSSERSTKSSKRHFSKQAKTSKQDDGFVSDLRKELS